MREKSNGNEKEELEEEEPSFVVPIYEGKKQAHYKKQGFLEDSLNSPIKKQALCHTISQMLLSSENQ